MGNSWLDWLEQLFLVERVQLCKPLTDDDNPRKDDTFNQCWVDDGPASPTSNQHCLMGCERSYPTQHINCLTGLI